MADPKRVVEPAAQLVDSKIAPPSYGQKVLALTIGGVLVPTTWTREGEDFFEAWCAYPSIPATVKERMNSKYGKHKN